jgi:hypothetical protein
LNSQKREQYLKKKINAKPKRKMKRNQMSSIPEFADASFVYCNDNESSSQYFLDLKKKSKKRPLVLPRNGLTINEVKKGLLLSRQDIGELNLEAIYQDYLQSTTCTFIKNAQANKSHVTLYALDVKDGERFEMMMSDQLSRPLEKRIIVPPHTFLFLYVAPRYFKRLSFLKGPLTSSRAILKEKAQETGLKLFFKRKFSLQKHLIVQKIDAFTPAAIRVPEIMGERNVFSLVIAN